MNAYLWCPMNLKASIGCSASSVFKCARVPYYMHAWWRSSSIRSVHGARGRDESMHGPTDACMHGRSLALYRVRTYVCACSARSSKCKARIAYYATTWVLPYPAMLALRSKIKRTIHLFVLRNSKAGDHVDGATRRVMMHVSRLRIYFAVTTHTALYCVCCNPALCVSLSTNPCFGRTTNWLLIDQSIIMLARSNI